MVSEVVVLLTGLRNDARLPHCGTVLALCGQGILDGGSGQSGAPYGGYVSVQEFIVPSADS